MFNNEFMVRKLKEYMLLEIQNHSNDGAGGNGSSSYEICGGVW